MNKLVPIIVLAVLAAALGIGLLVRHKRAVDQQKQDLAVFLSVSNDLKKTSLNLDEARGVIANLEQDVATRTRVIGTLSNQLLATSNTLSRTTDDLGAARKAIQEAQEEIARRDNRIESLEAEYNSLGQRASELTNAIVGLNRQIADVERKLAVAEGDKVFLETQLRRLMSEKADLEQKFNDLEVLRAQIKQLREELVIARRVEWVRRGLWHDPSVKGGQQLMTRSSRPSGPTVPAGRQYDLNVEIDSDGNIRVTPATNAPTAVPPQ